jgi:hypothetical protein
VFPLGLWARPSGLPKPNVIELRVNVGVHASTGISVMMRASTETGAAHDGSTTPNGARPGERLSPTHGYPDRAIALIAPAAIKIHLPSWPQAGERRTVCLCADIFG